MSMSTTNGNGQRMRSIVDFGRLETELAAEARKIPTMAELGKVGADAVNKQYEEAALQLEQLGNESRIHVAKLEARIAELHKDIALIADGAAAIRDRAKSIELVINDAALFSQEVRAIVAAITKKVGE